MPPDRWSIMPDAFGAPFALACDGVAVLHLVPSVRTEQHVARIVALLNKQQRQTDAIDPLTAYAQAMGLYEEAPDA